jgi:hypothetical protein
MWNGSVAQCNAFISATGISYPMLRLAGSAGLGSAYGISWDISFVVDGDGVIVYRGGGFNASGVTSAVQTALDDLAAPVGDAPSSKGFEFLAAYPNPFNPMTNIQFEIGAERASASVQVDILDVRGRRIARLADSVFDGGRTHTVPWNGMDDRGISAASGTYLAAVTVDGVQKSRFITLVK